MVFSSLVIQKRLAHTHHTGFWLCLKGNISQTIKSSSCKKNLSQMCMLSVQLASTNDFYSMWSLKDITFYTNSSLPEAFLLPPRSCVPWNKCFERSRVFVFWRVFVFTNCFYKLRAKSQSIWHLYKQCLYKIIKFVKRTFYKKKNKKKKK